MSAIARAFRRTKSSAPELVDINSLFALVKIQNWDLETSFSAIYY